MVTLLPIVIWATHPLHTHHAMELPRLIKTGNGKWQENDLVWCVIRLEIFLEPTP